MILKPNNENIKKAVDAIQKGEIVAFPTETVYGLGGDATNPIAVSKIFEAKERPSFNPLIAHIADYNQLNEIAKVQNPLVEKLVYKFWPGPLTVVLPKKKIIPDIVTAGHETVAVRMPANELALKLIRESRKPIAAPSANAFGFLSPTRAEHVEKQLGERVKIILDGGKCEVGVESTIVEFMEDRIKVLRPGGLAIEQIEDIVGEVEFIKQPTEEPNAPGMLLHHYAPKVKIQFIDEAVKDTIEYSKTGVLAFSETNNFEQYKICKVLSTMGDMHEAAANLFKNLHLLENENVNLILVERVPETGLGIAIMDRLNKAVNRYR
jgi:L-threonylcarbamoyladenylate synthase